jgi:PhnB protein
MAISLSPYVHFVDNAQAAIDFYKSVFGGETEIHKFGEYGTPENDPPGNLIMHCEINFAGTKLYISDSLPMGGVKQDGENITLSLVGDKADEETLTKFFNGLADGGKVTDPLSVKPWGANFGMLTDKFGIHWMVNINQD